MRNLKLFGFVFALVTLLTSLAGCSTNTKIDVPGDKPWSQISGAWKDGIVKGFDPKFDKPIKTIGANNRPVDDYVQLDRTPDRRQMFTSDQRVHTQSVARDQQVLTVSIIALIIALLSALTAWYLWDQLQRMREASTTKTTTPSTPIASVTSDSTSPAPAVPHIAATGTTTPDASETNASNGANTVKETTPAPEVTPAAITPTDPLIPLSATIALIHAIQSNVVASSEQRGPAAIYIRNYGGGGGHGGNAVVDQSVVSVLDDHTICSSELMDAMDEEEMFYGSHSNHREAVTNERAT